MSISARVHFQNMDGSPGLETVVRKHVDKLQRFYAHVIACEVTVEAPHHHQHKGFKYCVMIKMMVPGDVLVVSHERSTDPSHENCYAAIHDAFNRARRRLQDYARIRRHDVKHHEKAGRSVLGIDGIPGPDHNTEEPEHL